MNNLDTDQTFGADQIALRKEARLLCLLRRRYAHRPKLMQAFAEWEVGGGGDNPSDSYGVLSLCAAIILVTKNPAGVTAEDVVRLRETRQGRPEAHRFLKRAARGVRLIDRALTAGCVKRGEVTAAGRKEVTR